MNIPNLYPMRFRLPAFAVMLLAPLLFSACSDSPAGPDAVAAAVKFVTVPAGTLSIPDAAGGDSRRIEIPYDFEMSSCEITQEEYQALIGLNPSWHQGAIYPGWKKRPVEHVTWFDAILFCNELSRRRGLTPVYSYDYVEGESKTGVIALPGLRIDETANGYRLPTPAEWEYACRAGTVTDFYTGDLSGNGFECNVPEPTAERAGWYCTNTIDNVHPVGETKMTGLKEPNAFGLYDMHGNVWEWCGQANFAVGGSWANPPFFAQASAEAVGAAWPDGCHGNARYFNVGFRVVRKLP